MDTGDWSDRFSGDRSFLITMIGCGLTLAVGVAATSYGSTIPVFSVSDEAVQSAFMAWCTEEPKIDHAAGDRYFALFTNHYAWIDFGVGLVLTALAIAVIASILRARSAPDDTWLRTPQQRWAYLVLGAGALLWFFAAGAKSFMIDFERMYFPTCADSMAIPLFETAVSAMITIPFMVGVGFTLTRFFGGLPTPLHQWDRERPVRSWVVSTIFGAAAFAVAALLVDSILTSMSVTAPALIVGIYLLASTRAALLSPSPSAGRDAVTDCR